jgi:hypothetical protein
MRIKSLIHVLCAVLVLAPYAPAFAQDDARSERPGGGRGEESVFEGERGEKLRHRQLPVEEMNGMWERINAEPDGKALVGDMEKKGFTRVLNEQAAWGVTGTLVGRDGAEQEVMLCVYDFLDKNDIGHGGSLVWARVGKKTYRAYWDFPSGEKDGKKKLEKAKEWYAERGQIKRANSFGTRFKQCVQRGNPLPGIETELSGDRSRLKIGGGTYTVSCPTQCLVGAIGCTSLAAGVAVVTIGVIAASGGTLTLEAIVVAGGIGAAMLLACGGLSCGSCFLLCGLAAL